MRGLTGGPLRRRGAEAPLDEDRDAWLGHDELQHPGGDAVLLSGRGVALQGVHACMRLVGWLCCILQIRRIHYRIL